MKKHAKVSDSCVLVSSDPSPMSQMNPVNPELAEIADILAAGLMRLGTRKSSRISTKSGERSLHFTPDQSGDAATCSPGVDA
jgi:hypothetical protein